MIGAPSTFETQFQDFVFYAGPILQLLFWLVMIVAALWAVSLFKRWVDFQTGESSKTGSTPTSAGSAEAEERVKIEEFVE